MKKNMLFRCACIILFTAISFGSNAQKNESKKINIIDFKVEKNQNKVSVNWSTDKTTPTNYFELEKSSDGKNFKTIAYILGPDPSKTDCDCYGCFDQATTNIKESYYRLKHISANGDVEFSETRLLALNK
jgi:hypothetical protein